MELCDECNNCTKFQLYTEKPVRDIQSFVIVHYFETLQLINFA